MCNGVNGLVAAAAAALLAGAAVAVPHTFYVDANYGSDSYDGSTNATGIVVAEGKGPKKTLAAAAALVTATSSKTQEGDTVYVAEGDYNEGTMVASSVDYRLVMKYGMRLIGSGRKEHTLLNGCGEVPVIAMPVWCLVKNVTICNGYGPGGIAGGYNGGGVQNGGGIVENISGSFVVGCIVSNCYSETGAGGACAGGATAAAIRTLFYRNWSDRDASRGARYGGYMWNCIFDQGDLAEERSAGSDMKTYNCTFVNCTKGANGSGYLYNCLLVSGTGNSAKLFSSIASGNRGNNVEMDEASLTNQGVANTRFDADYMPVYGANVGIDHGDEANWTTNFAQILDSPLIQDQANIDFYGNPRVAGSGIDCGAVEYSAELSRTRSLTLSVTDAKGGLTIEGASAGTTYVTCDESNITLRISRKYTTKPVAKGINVNGEFFAFNGETEDQVFEAHVDFGGVSTNLAVEAVYGEGNDWYVNCDTGDDMNDGYAPYRAKKTLVGAVTNSLVAAKDTIHVAPGVYKEGEMRDSYGSKNRVIVPNGVWLVGDEGPEQTVILGARDNDGLGPNAVRPVMILDTQVAYVRGFTITGGATRGAKGTDDEGVSSDYARYGGGVFSKEGYIIDCIITNNICYNVGGGVYGARVFRCLIGYNWCGNNEYNMVYGHLIGSVALHGYYSQGRATNCLFLPGASINSARVDQAGKCLINCVVCDGSTSTSCSYSNTLYGATAAYSIYDDASRQVSGLSAMFDENYRPKAGTVPVNYGNTEYYRGVLPAELAGLDADVLGGQRIYGGDIDCGAGEYDWRPAFSQALSPKCVEVTEATENVTLPDGGSLTLAEGESVKIVCTSPVAGQVSFLVAGDGAATVTVDGAALTPQAGVYSFSVDEDVSRLVEISCVSGGSVEVSAFTVPKKGSMIILK